MAGNKIPGDSLTQRFKTQCTSNDIDGSQDDVLWRTVWDDSQSGSRNDEDRVSQMKVVNELFHVVGK